MAATVSYDQNGVAQNSRRVSRAYEPPVISRGMVIRQDSDRNSPDHALSPAESVGRRFDAVGGVLAKGALGSLTLAGALVSIVGKASLEAASQLFGFMLLMVLTFIVSTGSFYWWGGNSKNKVSFSVRKVTSIYLLCVSSEIVARIIAVFTSVPATSGILGDAGYFISLAVILLVVFSLFVHKEGLNAMFSWETMSFVLSTVFLNFSASCLFQTVLPAFVVPHMIYAAALLGLSIYLAGYRFPKISPSRLYWMLSDNRPARPVVHVQSTIPSSRDELMPSRKDSLSSTVSKRVSMSSVSSMNSYYPGFDTEVVNEAHGLLTELLFNKDALSSDAHQKLKRVKDILAPRMEVLSHAPMHVGNQIDHADHDYEGDVSNASSLRHGNQLVVQPHIHKHKKRSASVVQMRRSTTKFATTTTSSGMPVLEHEPVDRARSLALRDVKARISVQEKRHSVHRMSRDKALSSEGTLSPRTAHRNISEKSSLTHSLSATVSESELSGAESNVSSLHASTSAPALPQIDKDGSAKSAEGEKTIEGRQPIATPPKHRPAKINSLQEDLQIIKEGAELEVEPERPRSATLPSNSKFSAFKTEKDDVGKDERVFSQGPIGEHKFYSFTKYRKPSVACDLSEYTSNEHLDMFENVAIWDYPIFELEENAGNHILSHMAHMLFHEAGLMETFKIPQREFVNYFRALETNYGSNVYHNKTHAADVLHAVSYLLFEIIPEFSHEFSYGQDGVREWKGHSRTMNGSGGNVASAFSILEVLACYMASAMHDFDHPGRTNAFLVATRTPLAVLYNDRSVLENHHAAASWHLLTNFEENNFLVSLEESELKRLRFLIIEGILATDLKMHFDILATFKSKVNPEEGGGINWESEIDRMLVMKMIIKMADINTPTKSFSLHRQWTGRITEEFYQQSEEEEKLRLPATIFMDRRHPEKLPAVQLSFIQHLVSPLFQAAAEAGIIPGILEPYKANSATPGPEGEEGSTTETQGETAEDSDHEEVEASKFMSIILTNLQINFDGWKAELPPEDKKEEEAAATKEDKKEEVEGDVKEESEKESSDVIKVTVTDENDLSTDKDQTTTTEMEP